MERSVAAELDRWLTDERRLPVVLRGARQVGKTWLARDLAQRSERSLVEVNFERNPELASVFAASSPEQIVGELELAIDQDVEAASTILFLDEIQAAPVVLAKLRWFAEEMPQLPVIAAGSLLEFALAEHEFSVPVGRVTYRHIEPMGFAEFLRAHDQLRMLDHLTTWTGEEPLSASAHRRGLEWQDRFAMIGGMPAVVASDVAHHDPKRCRRLQVDLVAAFRDDSSKYVGRMDPAILDAVLFAVAAQLGEKFVYARVGQGIKQHQAKRALELLANARLVTLAAHSNVSGLPLGGDVNPRNRKALFLDIGSAHALLGTPAGRTFPAWNGLAPAVRGSLAEQLAGQQLRALDVADGGEPSLHYWQRGGGRPGAIDFVVQVGHRIVPVELKSGATGAMKSLHQFMFDKQLDLAVRVDRNPPSLQEVDVKTTQGDPVSYRILNLPSYLLWRFEQLVAECGAPRA